MEQHQSACGVELVEWSRDLSDLRVDRICTWETDERTRLFVSLVGEGMVASALLPAVYFGSFP